ncbi:MAG: hypothetical protein LBB39_00485 [Mycoplasmataceae bacterium]|nr:hypothetical protein [Mycoplasmataceae bacterium]
MDKKYIESVRNNPFSTLEWEKPRLIGEWQNCPFLFEKEYTVPTIGSLDEKQHFLSLKKNFTLLCKGGFFDNIDNSEDSSIESNNDYLEQITKSQCKWKNIGFFSKKSMQKIIYEVSWLIGQQYDTSIIEKTLISIEKQSSVISIF